MRNNSLRQQSRYNWQHKYGNRISHTISQLRKDSGQVNRDNFRDVKVNGNQCDQHSELKWLEKMVKDIQDYGEGGIKGDQEQEIEVQRVNKQEERKDMKEAMKKTIKKDVTQPDSKRSARRIKFEIIPKQNKPPSERKSINTYKPSHKTKDSKIHKKFSYPLNDSSRNTPSTSQVKSYATSLKKQQYSIDNVQTDPCSYEISYNSSINKEQNLWKGKSQSVQIKIELNQLWEGRKSVGKIVKNNSKQKSIGNYSSEKSIVLNKSKSIEIPSNKKHPKVFLKLQTSNLSKYLGESSLKPEKSSKKLLKAEQYERTSPKKRVNSLYQPRRSEIDVERSAMRQEKTELLFRKTHHIQTLQNGESSNLKSSRQRKIDRIMQKCRPAQREKNEQRKLNKSVSTTKQIEQFQRDVYLQRQETEQTIQNQFLPRKSSQRIGGKPTEKQVIYPSNSQYITQSVQRQQSKDISFKKSFYFPSNEDKLFTLYSQPAEKEDNEQSFKLSEDSTDMLEHGEASKPKEHQELACESIHLIEPQRESMSTSQKQVEQEQTYQTKLFEIFYYLDEGSRKLLTSSNCRLEGLTEEIKILFSSIFHQIKTKKRAYSLEKFVKECQDVIKIKKQVYSQNQVASNQITSFLKASIHSEKSKNSIVRPPRPAPIIQQIESRQTSLRESSLDNQSVVLSKMIIKSLDPDFPSQIRHNTRQPLQELNPAQPELYFQQKYGLSSVFDDKWKNQMVSRGISPY